ncbi:MAG: dual specificity protein phosphatase family protein [Anaerolineae bacterium]
METPFPEAYWVEPGLLLAGAYAGQRWAHIADTNVPLLLKTGVRLFIDLTEEGEGLSYADQLGEQALYQRMPIPDHDAPSPAMMRAILNQIDRAIRQQQCVYVHCMAGLGRTGTVIGCYLARQGISGSEALDMLWKLRARTSSSRSPSPETEAQRWMVLHWPEGW